LLESPVGDVAVRRGRVEFLLNLPRSYQEGEVLYVHGSPRNPLNEYVFPEDIYNQRKMGRLSEKFERVCFNGHTHIPGIFVEDGREQWQFIEPEKCAAGFPLAGRKVICNAGAVGQPRDGDWRACYVLFDGARIWFRRVEYDVERTIQKIHAVPELDDFHGDRLRDGR
jgi:diadenosine tetraphosphatase ApaH/serine/threonine PP2A family protein phosphatase